ncbi:MAG: DNA phosphorothioation system sulfurtransferase DndC [Blastocatellia bacterium AA13]|nr:MAG: DNA phosphorothioation system sulfurtransferase DndC [Blastocatellia bacterium AA13]
MQNQTDRKKRRVSLSHSKSDGKPTFDRDSLNKTYDEIREVYRRYPQPWVIGYSGGKDSTCVLQLVWTALESLPSEERHKPVFVIASDTKVETPVIVDYIDSTLRRINETAKATGMPFAAEKVMPTLNNSFWVNLIGRGYPAPTTRFRWCTERLKIDPANRFINEKVTQYGEVIMVLGVRKAESSTRAQLMNTYQVKGHVLRRHSSLSGANVYAPIADFTTDHVWTYLLQVASPWGSNNRDLVTLYRNASAGECPLVIDDTTPTCGNSRFGCWVCTVATRDSSMEALVDRGEEWLEPLLDFREWLATTIDPARKREFRDIKGRDGRVIIKKDGKAAARTYKLEASRLMLEKVLRTQELVRKKGPDPSAELISEDELHEIRRLWRTERQDWDDSVPRIFHEVSGCDLDWPSDDNGQFNSDQKTLLEGICAEHDVPFDLVARLLEAERGANGPARRAGIQKTLTRVLAQEWRGEEEIIAEEQLKLSLV